MNPANTFTIPTLDGIHALPHLIVFISHDRLGHIPERVQVATFFPERLSDHHEWKQQLGTERRGS
jgi:hypothetical protein